MGERGGFRDRAPHERGDRFGDARGGGFRDGGRREGGGPHADRAERGFRAGAGRDRPARDDSYRDSGPRERYSRDDTRRGGGFGDRDRDRGRDRGHGDRSAERPGGYRRPTGPADDRGARGDRWQDRGAERGREREADRPGSSSVDGRGFRPNRDGHDAHPGSSNRADAGPGRRGNRDEPRGARRFDGTGRADQVGRPHRRPDDNRREGTGTVDERSAPREPEPALSDEIDARDLDREVREELRSLARPVAERVARHLVAAGQLVDESPEVALAHAVAARRLAPRIAAVREAAGLTAYFAGEWQNAIAELRTYHRMTGRQTHLAVIADCERALGRPERAVDLYRTVDRGQLAADEAAELLIVAAGARGDLGQHDAAVAMLQVRELTSEPEAPWAARLRYAYADALLAADRRDEAREWFARAAEVDEELVTDAAERLLDLDGVVIEDAIEEPAGDEDGAAEVADVADVAGEGDGGDAASGEEPRSADPSDGPE